MIRFPTALSQVEGPRADPTPVVRAGGADLGERRRLGLAPGPLLDLRDLAELELIE